MFTDQVTTKLIAGKGGNGVVAWRREKFIPKGGPTGGNGGPGGDIYLQADAQCFSLDWFRNKSLVKSEKGTCGGPNRRQGRRGKDLVIKVPCGTLIKSAKTDELLYDLCNDGEKFQLLKGGRAGLGNAHFKKPTRQAPNFCTLGLEGDVLKVDLELKLIADIGLVGFPNAGKSTFLEIFTQANVKTASYPFTTLRPNLGYVETEDYRRLVIADIPGIIRDAHKNKGLGLEFLKHIERTKALVFILDTSGFEKRNPVEDFLTLKNELSSYDEKILKKPYIIVLNKSDIEGYETLKNVFFEKFSEERSKIFCLSLVDGNGQQQLKEEFFSLIQEQ